MTVCVLGPVKKANRVSHTLGLQAVRSYLLGKQIPCNAVYTIVKEEEGSVVKDEINPDAANILSIHQSKGLEFDLVILIDAVHHMTNRVPNNTMLTIQKNLMYVAVTRAKQMLSIYNNIDAQVNTWLLKAIEAGVIYTSTKMIVQPGPT